MKLKYRILIAEDDEDDQLLLSSAFEEKGKNCELSFVKDGLELLNQLENNSALPDLVMLDLNMPKVNGWEILSELSKNSQLQHIPRLIFSTSSADKEIKKAYGLGAAAYIVKPASYEELERFVESIISFYFNTVTLA